MNLSLIKPLAIARFIENMDNREQALSCFSILILFYLFVYFYYPSAPVTYKLQ